MRSDCNVQSWSCRAIGAGGNLCRNVHRKEWRLVVAYCGKEQHQFAKSVDAKQCEKNNETACRKHGVCTRTCTSCTFRTNIHSCRSHSNHSRRVARRVRGTCASHCPARKQISTRSGEWEQVLLRAVSDLLPLAQKLATYCWCEFGSGIVESDLERKSGLSHVSAQQRLGPLGVASCCCWQRN